jgi:uncharacterized protein
MLVNARDAVQFFRDWGLQDRVRGYAVFGGMPYYLSLIDARESLAENIDQLFLTSEAAPLREEPRNVRYRVADPFLAFHYRFVTPNLTALETAPSREFYEALIAPDLDEYTSGVFEEMAREYVRRYGREVLPSAAREVGRIFASEFDVDVAGMLLDGSAVFGEAKWSVKHVGLNQVSELQSRIARVNYLKDVERKYLFLFSRSGFSPQVGQLAESDPLVRPISLKQMLSI